MLMKTGAIAGAKDHLEIDSLLQTMITAQSEKWRYRNAAEADSVITKPNELLEES
jgi:hypothetical protein